MQLINAFQLGREFRSGNTTLDNTDRGKIVRLYGNKIAQLDGVTLYLSSAGYETATTKSRLNAILSFLMPGASIYQKSFEWYICFNGKTVKFAEVENKAIECVLAPLAQ